MTKKYRVYKVGPYWFVLPPSGGAFYFLTWSVAMNHVAADAARRAHREEERKQQEQRSLLDWWRGRGRRR